MIASRVWTRSGAGASGDGRRDRFAPHPFAVGPAMTDRGQQPLANVTPHVRRETRMEEESAGDAAHVRVPLVAE